LKGSGTPNKMFIDMVKSGKALIGTQAEINRLKKTVRREVRRYNELNDNGYDDFDVIWIRGPSSKDEKIYYGSDSDSDLDTFGEDVDPQIEAFVHYS
jgi:hypothetical protein